MKAFINGKKYEIEAVFNMVLNYDFIDKHGVHHLVDGWDVVEWAEEEGIVCADGLKLAIKYARYYAFEVENGVFWWKRFKIERDFVYGSQRIELSIV